MTAKVPAKTVDEWRPLFLGALRNSANVRAACQVAGIARATAYKSRAASQEFAAAWDEAVEDACDILEADAWTRARKQSDVLIIFLLKAHRPAKYRETYNVQITIRQEAERLATETGVPVEDIMARFNALVGTLR
jgi:hypothetical protein